MTGYSALPSLTEGHLLGELLCRITVTQVNTVLWFLLEFSHSWYVHHGSSESVISVLSINCTICESVIVTVPAERDQANGVELLLTRTEAQAHPAPLVCKRVYFLPKFIH